MIIKDIFRVIYSPIKAFESIVKKPDFKGPILILAIILACVAAEQYVFASKILLSPRTPTNDQWTESTFHWTSNGVVSLVNNTYVIGNYSIKSQVSNATSIWLETTNIGSLNCIGDEGYNRMSFWINWVHQAKISPNNSTLRLFYAGNGTRYFKQDMSTLISKYSGNWSTSLSGIDIGPSSQGWSSVNSPNWANITGVEFRLNWSTRANLTMYIDDLYFLKKPFSFISTTSMGDQVILYLISTIIGFFLTWIIYVGSFFIVSVGSKQKMGSWRSLFIIIGYTFASAIVSILVRAILFASLPSLTFPLNSYPALTNDDAVRASVTEQLWYPYIAYPLTLIPNLGIDVWIVALCAVAVHAFGGVSWKKAAVFAVFAYFIKFFLFGPRSMI